MSNHGNDGGPDEISEFVRARFAELNKALRDQPIKPLGFKPLSPDDEGPIQFAIGSDGPKVFLKFHKPIDWLGMDPEDAVALAEGLIKYARDAARHAGKPLTVKIG